MTGESTHSSADRLYEKIKMVAIAAMRAERPGHTLQPTAVASEAFIRLSDHRAAWASDEQFMQAVVSTVRRVLIDHARKKNRHKRGGGWRRVELNDAAIPAPTIDLLELDELLTELAQRDEQAAFVMEAAVFGGLRDDQIASLLSTDVRSVQLSRRRGRAWIASRLDAQE